MALLLHGLMASNRVFDEVIDQGRREFRFLAVDLPHSGQSRGWSSMKPVEIARTLKRWLDAKGVKRATVFGHSFGGLVALELAAQFPGLIDRLVVASTPALGLAPEAKRFLNLPGAEDGASLIGKLPLWRPLVRGYVGWLFGDPKKLSERQVEGYFQSLQNPGAWPGMLEASRAVAEYRLQAEAIRATKIPIEIVWGERDRLVPLIDGERLATALDAGFSVLPGVGHCVPEEHPQSVLAAIRGDSRARKANDRGRSDPT